jgi:magnesium transporter
MSGAIDLDRSGAILLKELGTGLFLGLVYGLASGLLAWFLFDTLVVEKIVGITVLVNTTLAATLSRGLPLLFERIHQNPAMVPGPLLSSILDVLGIVNYFLIARWFLAA